MKLNFTVFDREFRIYFSTFKKRKFWTKGIYNGTMDGKYIIFLDYDKIEYNRMIEELKRFQATFSLSDFYLFQSSPRNYHAICLDKISPVLFTNILANSLCDVAFKNVPHFTQERNWVLRYWHKGATEKPKYIYTLKSSEHIREKSRSHAIFLTIMYPSIKIQQKRLFDNNFLLLHIDYPTSSNVNAKEIDTSEFGKEQNG